MAIVYLHLTEKNVPFYVGIGKEISRANYFKNRSKFWHRTKDKYGIKVQILFKKLSWREAIKKEIELITFYGRRDLGTGTLCNLTKGGEGVVGNKLNKKQLEAHRLQSIGRKLSKEAKLKLSKSVEQYSKEGIILNTFTSMKEAHEKTSVNSRGISEVCRGNRKTAGGYIWKYKKINK